MKITDKENSNSSGNYVMTIGDAKVAYVISRAHAAVISSGTELEKIILDKCKTVTHEELNEFIEEGIMPKEVCVVRKKEIKKSILQTSKSEPDLFILVPKGNSGTNKCYIIELKAGHAFDTKKIQGEMNSMKNFVNATASKVPCTMEWFFCAFNSEDKDKIFYGFKQNISKDHILTGKELCEILNINYDDIVSERKKDWGHNLDYIAKRLVGSDAFLQKLIDHILKREGGKDALKKALEAER